jgi:hypothetical protein
MPNHRSRASRGLLAGLLSLAAFASGAVALVAHKPSAAATTASAAVAGTGLGDDDGDRGGTVAVRDGGGHGRH